MRTFLCILVAYILVCLIPTEGQQRYQKRMCSRIPKLSNCVGEEVRWRYDKDKDKCKPFLSGDCTKNKGFPTCRSCMKTCQRKLPKGKNEKGMKPSKEENYIGICPPYE
ncbi:uncharacterized protein LOC119459476 [Dermacentor silvarum]|uniref:uncharacterized protein LOC119459476 n=1 Tax=Dermacentor silvarum TaxID=543639 RepID=UPI0018970CFF|nr:uncharacterized protein LOC119459476 [Dermacentor silvarum]